MTKQTSYHGWDVPETGDTDYETTFDALFDLWDTEIVEKGTKSSRPSAATSGRWYLATDEPALYFDDGNNWSKIGGQDQTGNTLKAANYEAAQSTSTPYAYHFANDTNSGLYRTGANAIALATGGTDAVNIDSSQAATFHSGLTVKSDVDHILLRDTGAGRDATIEHDTTINFWTKGSVRFGIGDTVVTLDGTNLEDAANNIIYDHGNNWVPTSILEADSITLNGGDGLKGGSAASLGGSFSLDVEPADFAGTLLSDDGSDNLQVDESNISHDAIDQATVDSSDHHTRPSAGDGLTDNSNTFDLEPSDFAGEGLEDDGSDNLKVKEPFAYDPGMTEWGDGLSNEEINRLVLQSGETLVVERIEFRQKGGGSSASASIDVRDTGAGSTIGSQDLGGTTKDPGSSNSGNTILVRVSNSTGSAIDAAPRVTGYIGGA